ncbi:MAG: nitrogen regulation protein NR(I) [Parvibaculales bacterium]
MSKGTILVADDDTAIRTVVTQALGRAGYEVKATSNAATLWRWASAGEGDLIVTDVVMPDENAFDLIPRIKRLRPDLPIIVMSALNTLSTAVTAAERGAYEYLPKPFDLKELLSITNRAISAQETKSTTTDSFGDDEMPLIGRSPAMQDIYRGLARLMQNDLTVMVSGESGTGKELIARALHELGQRQHGPFVAINMAAIPKDLIESELFGHEKGAFTGANQRVEGRFAQADGGTLFLDEIGDMPMDTQTRLLRVLQEGEFTTVGGRTPIKTDVRIVAATNKDLKILINQGLFREDLYYRLNVVPLRIPPLRNRLEDLEDLCRHFLKLATQEGLPAKSVSPEGIAYLKKYNWPGNVRELENLMRRIAALYNDEVIGSDILHQELSDLAPTETATVSTQNAATISESVDMHLAQYFNQFGGALPPAGLYDRVLKELEEPLIRQALAATNGNQIKTAELLGLNRNTLRKKIRELGIDVIRQSRRS